jgi:mycothiol synthase
MDGLDLAAVVEPGPSLGSEIAALLDRVTSDRRHPALGEQKRLALVQAAETGAPSGDRHVFVGLVARVTGDPGLCAYAQIDGSAPRRAYALELAVDPAAERPEPVADALIEAAVAEVATRGGGTLRLWTSMAGPADDVLASAHGFRIERDLVQLRCGLPLSGEAVRGNAPPIDVQPFRPGIDEDAWLATNNRAFAAHPEQGAWDLARLAEREKEPWFDPAGFLVLEWDGRLAGSCWTKVHASTDPPMGEIYVIGVDPDFQGRGWGRALTLAGLDWLARRGLGTGMLYADRSNRTAISLYRSMGFVEHHVDRSYVASIEPA